jgi:hypothetical protein
MTERRSVDQSREEIIDRYDNAKGASVPEMPPGQTLFGLARDASESLPQHLKGMDASRGLPPRLREYEATAGRNRKCCRR